MVGRIGRAHGLRGECKVFPECDDPARLKDLEWVWVGTAPTSARRVASDAVRISPAKRGVVARMRLGGAQSREEAEQYRNMNMYARTEDLPPLAPGEYFLHDLVGMQVTTTGGDSVGEVKNVWEMPSNDMLVVARPDGQDALIPLVPAFIHDTNLAERRVVISPIEGLLD